jgi:transformer-2 protein
MVYDAKSRGFKGYCFIYYTKIRDATAALSETNGIEVKDRRIRVDYSKTKRAHTPTPGFYRGNRGQRNRSFERQRPPRREFNHAPSDRFRRDEHPRHRSRDRVERSFRDNDRDREMRHRSDGRRRSMERGMNRRSPPRRETFRRRDRS